MITLKLHYHRREGDYTGWNLWIWSLRRKAEAISFAPEGSEMVATLTGIHHGTGSLCFLLRRSIPGDAWAEREFSERSIDLSEVLSGTVHYYVESGVWEGRRVLAADVCTGNKITRAELDYDTGRIHVTTALPVEPQAVTLWHDGREVPALCTGSQGSYTLQLPGIPALSGLYRRTLRLAGLSYAIGISHVYESERFRREYLAEDSSLGALWSPEATVFRLWAPTAEAVRVALYASGDPEGQDRIRTIALTPGERGLWEVRVPGDLHGVYYTFLVKVEGEDREVCDPYARTTGVNGHRAMVLNQSLTEPEGWAADRNPNPLEAYTDAVLYELHIRDFSMDHSSGVRESWKGKFLALTQTGTTTAGGARTGLDYLKSLGITHLHLLPVFDYGSVDERWCSEYNWGYDPLNYNVPEGAYATDPYHGEVRVRELKQMVKALHDSGISVVLDVVYNHVYQAESFCFNRIVPGYFSRRNADGSLSNGSGCGNDTASERAMVRKYIVESVLYWKETYHIDGFRFDLVGLLDADTVNSIVAAVHGKYPDVIFYGEGWSMDTAVAPGTVMATQRNAAATPGFAYFSDTMRDLLGGRNGTRPGFVSGGTGMEQQMAECCMAAPGWTREPCQVVQYASCHDNYTLADKLVLSAGKEAVDGAVIRQNNLAAAMYLTAQGIPFIHAGEELLREKCFRGRRWENSYNAPDAVNALRWSRLDQGVCRKSLAYYQGLLRFRRAHAALRLRTAAEVAARVRYHWLTNEVIALQITGDREILAVFNASGSTRTVRLPEGTWDLCVDGHSAGTQSIALCSGTVDAPPVCATILVRRPTQP